MAQTQLTHTGNQGNPVAYDLLFNATATTEIYTLSLHDALPILEARELALQKVAGKQVNASRVDGRLEHRMARPVRSEEHTSELQSQSNLVCRLLLEKKKPN